MQHGLWGTGQETCSPCSEGIKTDKERKKMPENSIQPLHENPYGYLFRYLFGDLLGYSRISKEFVDTTDMKRYPHRLFFGYTRIK
jgi:hypothetical protein